MALKDIKSIGTPARMRNRVYVFAISTLAAALLAIAFVKPNAATNVSQSTIQVPKEFGLSGVSPIAERINSIAFLRKVGAHHGVASGLEPSSIEGILDDWAHNVRDTLVIQPAENATEDAGDTQISLQYRGVNDKQSLSVMNSLLTTLETFDASESTSTAATPAARMRIRAIERRLGQARQSLDLYVTEELARMKSDPEAYVEEASNPVSLNVPSDSESGFPDLPAPVQMQDDSLEMSAAIPDMDLPESGLPDLDLPEPALPDPALPDPLQSVAEGQGQSDWLSEQKAIDEANDLVRNPEYDVLVRALVRSQAERQELLIRFEPSHAAIRRAENEISELELLVSHTKKYLDDGEYAESSNRAKAYTSELASAQQYGDRGFDESQAIAMIQGTKPFRTLAATIQTAEQELQNATDPNWIAARSQNISVLSAPQLTSSNLAELPWSKVLLLGAISSLLGFVMSRMGDSVSVPDVFYSILDVNESLKIPVVGQVAMDGTPSIPKRERVASVGFWRKCVRLAEGVAVLMLVAFVLLLITHPAMLKEITGNPVAAYMHAFQEFRNYVPVPYLFK